jgi:hypothetical protein
MRHEIVTRAEQSGIDWKGIGYLFSIAGALLLGAESWPKSSDPAWHMPALVTGVAVTIIGFGVRYLAHLKERRQIAEAKREARKT